MSQCSRAELRNPWSCLLFAAAICACEDPLTDPALIAGPRIVGARVGAELDPALAEPAAGQAATLDWLVLSDQPGAFTAQVAWCIGAPTVLGAPRCSWEPFAEQSATGRFGEPLRFGFNVPAELEPGEAWLAWIGICGSGEARFDPAASVFVCGEGEPLSGFYRGFVPEGAPNRNPSLADDSLLLDGAPWLAPDVVPPGAAPPGSVPLEVGAACLGLGLPELRAEQPSSVLFELGGDDREELENVPGTYAAHSRESLVYTHLATQPGLDRAFSAIDYDATELAFEVPFDADPPASAEGTTLRFFLLARDERGGLDWLMRQACVMPP
jgi:hypothetical protein